MPTLDEVSRRDEVIGGSGVRLAVRTAGPAGGPPVVFLHGWAQSGRAWANQLTGPLSGEYRLVAADLRGHGDSSVPADGYDSADEWADDVRALLDYAGRPAVLVGWSYGGLVITDYLRRHGTDGVAGLALVGAITEIGRGHPGGRVGPAMRAALPDALSDDPDVAWPTLLAFVTGMSDPGSAGPVATALAEDALRVPAAVRKALFARDVDSAEVLAAVDVPTLVLHGRRDKVVDPSVAEYTAGLVPGATLTWFDRVGHLPFAECAQRFDTAIADHLDRCFALVGGTA
ncbi:MAG TPA: alpha/beta hydrolase [Pseudonocardiaceae bacterium]|nr:alpha/beta hydrolase [Pseudonocardiaceae bacterium]